MIRMENLAKSFRRRPTVRAVSFLAANGAMTGILGANGAGKTTALRAIAGVLSPDAGKIAVDGSLGAVPDHTGICGRLSVREPGVFRPVAWDRRRRTGGSCGGHDRSFRPDGDCWANGGRIVPRRADEDRAGSRRSAPPRNLPLDEPNNGLDVGPYGRFAKVARQTRRMKLAVAADPAVADPRFAVAALSGVVWLCLAAAWAVRIVTTRGNWAPAAIDTRAANDRELRRDLEG